MHSKSDILLERLWQVLALMPCDTEASLPVPLLACSPGSCIPGTGGLSARARSICLQWQQSLQIFIKGRCSSRSASAPGAVVSHCVAVYGPQADMSLAVSLRVRAHLPCCRSFLQSMPFLQSMKVYQI